MKDHLHFFIIFTLLEIAFSVLYYLVVKTVNTTLLIGAALYLCSMVAGYFCYRDASWKARKKQLLDALP
jgi:cation transporter-like permease